MRFWSLWHEDLWQNMTRFVERGLCTCNFSMKTCQTCQQQKLEKCWLRKLLRSHFPYAVLALGIRYCHYQVKWKGFLWKTNSVYLKSHDCTISKYCHTINKNTQKRKKNTKTQDMQRTTNSAIFKQKAQQNVFGTKSSEFISTQGADYRKSFDYKLWVALRLINYIRVMSLSY